MTPLCTIGYAGYSAEEWLESLAANHVEIVVDVREMPLSRKPGFSKTCLAEMLRSKGIGYVHLKALGNPKTYRDRLRDGWDFVEFADEYRRILDAQPEALDALLALATHRRICLVCLEEDPAACHRSIVAEYVSESHLSGAIPQPSLRPVVGQLAALITFSAAPIVSVRPFERKQCRLILSVYSRLVGRSIL